MMLMNIFVNHTRADVKQMAGVLLRKKLGSVWPKLPQEIHLQIEQILVQIVNTSTVKVLATTAAEIIIVIAKLTLPIGKWQELMNIVIQWAQNNNEIQKEVGFGIIIELLPMLIQQKNVNLMNGMLQMVVQTLNSNCSLRIRVFAVRILGIMYDVIDTPQELTPFEQAVPYIVNMLKECHQTESEEEFSDVVDVVSDIIEAFCDVPEFEPIIQRISSPIASLCLEACKSKQVSPKIRMCALIYLQTFCSQQIEFCMKNGIIPPLVEALVLILAEYNPMDPTDEESPHRPYAGHVLTTLAELIPSNDFFALFWNIISPHLQNPQAGVISAVLMSLSNMAATCPVSIDEVGEILSPYVLSSLKHPEAVVRGAALKCIAEFGNASITFVFMNCCQYLAALIQAAQDPSSDLQSQAFFDIHLMVQKLSLNEIQPVSQEILKVCINSIRTTQDFDVRDAAISALSATVFLVEKQIAPHIEVLLEIATKLITSDIKEEIEMIQKGRGLELLVCIGKAMGKEQFRPYLNNSIEVVKKLLTIEHSFEYELRHFAYLALNDLFGMYGEELAPLIPAIVEKVIISFQDEHDDEEEQDELEISSDDEEEILKSQNPNMQNMPNQNQQNILDRISFHSGLLIEKAAAVTLVSRMFETVPLQMEPFAQQLITFINKMCADERSEVAESACEALWTVLYIPLAKERLYVPLGNNPVGANYVRNVNEESQARVHLTVDALPQSVLNVYREVMNTYFVVSQQSFDREIVIMCLNKMIDIFTLLGKQGAIQAGQQLPQLLMMILQQKTNSQTITGGENKEDIHEAESDLLATASDVITFMFKIFGQSMAQYFVQIYDTLSNMVTKRNNFIIKATAVGIIAEFFNYTGMCPDQIVEKTLALFLNCLQNRHEDIARNAAYGFGLLMRIAGNTQQHNQVCLNAAQHALGIIAQNLPTMKKRGLIDNFVSCVCRILQVPNNQFQAQQILPQLLNFLPIISDHEEEMNVYNTFVQFYTSNQILQQQKQALNQKLQQALTVEGIYPQTVQFLQQYLQSQ